VVTSAAPAQVAEASLGLAGVSAAPVRAGGVQISFGLTTKASVEVQVLNVAGRPVRVICRDRACTKGRNAVLWDGRSDAGTTAPPGIYLVKLRAYTEGGQQAQSLTSVRVVR
jgi:flagellar hook assembly protein FlgD